MFLKSGSKGCDGKEQDDKRGMVKIMCNISDTQVNVKARRPLSTPNILFSTHPIGVCSKIFYKTALWRIFSSITCRKTKTQRVFINNLNQF